MHFILFSPSLYHKHFSFSIFPSYFSNIYTIHTWIYAHSIWLYYMLVKYFSIEYFYSWFDIKATINIFQDIMASVFLCYLLLVQFWLLMTLWMMSTMPCLQHPCSPHAYAFLHGVSPSCFQSSSFLLPSIFPNISCVSKETAFSWDKIRNENIVFTSKET